MSQFFIIGSVSLIEKLSNGTQNLLNFEDRISFSIICSSLFGRGCNLAGDNDV